MISMLQRGFDTSDAKADTNISFNKSADVEFPVLA